MVLKINSGFNGITEPEVQTYIDAVEQADQQLIEFEVAQAINTFVRGCKNDGIWDAIKASCILAGARTLEGALVPLKGTAPTNFNFVSGDYNRKTGLVGNGSTKYLDSNRANNADPQDSNHNFVKTTTNMEGNIISSGSGTGTNIVARTTGPTLILRSRSSSNNSASYPSGVLFGSYGTARNNSTSYVRCRTNVGQAGTFTTDTISSTSETPNSANITILNFSSTRITFYSIGEFLNLQLLHNRVTTLINTFNSVIPS